MVTTVLIVASLIATAAIEWPTASDSEPLHEAREQVRAFHAERPHLRLPLQLTISPGTPTAEEIAAAASSLPADRADIEDAAERSEQEHLDSLVRGWSDAYEATPTRRFGFVPSKTNFLGLVTHAFIQPSWWVLLLHAWFLWLCGCTLETRWGHAVYAPVVAGALAAAAFTHKAFTASQHAALVGAAGIIAACLAALAVVQPRERVELVVPAPKQARTLHAPTWTFLVAWIIIQLVVGWTHVGVAPLAQLGGAVFGSLVAAAFVASGLDRRLDPNHGQATERHQDQRLQRAAELLAAGRAAEALALLHELASSDPSNIDVQLEMLRAAKVAGDATREIVAYGRLIELYMRAGAANTAMELFIEVKRLGREGELDAGDRVRVAERLARLGRLHEAAEVYVSVHEDGADRLETVRALVGHARVATKLGRDEEARGLLARAKQSRHADGPGIERAERELPRVS